MVEKKVLSSHDVANLYDVCIVTVRRYARDGRLKGCRVGRDWKFRAEDAEACFLGSVEKAA